jgi:hypothetical protein
MGVIATLQDVLDEDSIKQLYECNIILDCNLPKAAKGHKLDNLRFMPIQLLGQIVQYIGEEKYNFLLFSKPFALKVTNSQTYFS